MDQVRRQPVPRLPGTGHTTIPVRRWGRGPTRRPATADRTDRAITGKSSGGYAAMVTPLLRPGRVRRARDSCRRPPSSRRLLPARVPHPGAELRDLYDGLYQVLRQAPESRAGQTTSQDLQLLEMYGLRGVLVRAWTAPVLPYDELGLADPGGVERWLSRDPVAMVEQPQYAEALRSMRAVWIDAGKQDEYFLDLWPTAFHRAALQVGVPEERLHFELFEGKHGGIEYRYPLAVEWLCRQLG